MEGSFTKRIVLQEGTCRKNRIIEIQKFWEGVQVKKVRREDRLSRLQFAPKRATKNFQGPSHLESKIGETIFTEGGRAMLRWITQRSQIVAAPRMVWLNIRVSTDNDYYPSREESFEPQSLNQSICQKYCANFTFEIEIHVPLCILHEY